jgi:hypothetical protein
VEEHTGHYASLARRNAALCAHTGEQVAGLQWEVAGVQIVQSVQTALQRKRAGRAGDRAARAPQQRVGCSPAVVLELQGAR